MVVRVTIEFSPILDGDVMAGLDAIHTRNRFLRKASRAILSLTDLEQTCPNHRQIMLLHQSYE